MKRMILAVLMLISINTAAQELKVSINKLTEETQQLSESPDNLKLVWWIPVEFWEAVFAEDQAVPKEQADEILEVFGQYTMLATLDGKIGAFGDVDYKPRDEIFKAIKIIDDKKKSYSPLEESQIDDKTKSVLSFMKPVLGNMLGKMGNNMHFFLFRKKDNALDRIANPKIKGAFTVTLSGEQFHWKLPLGSLLKQKKCPVDNALLDGSWMYCPYHGKELISQ